MADVPRAKLPWMLVAASILLLVLVLYLIVNYLPAKQRITSLELELKELYAGEAGLQTKMVLLDQRSGLYERQVGALRVERDALARRIEELERELEVARSRRR